MLLADPLWQRGGESSARPPGLDVDGASGGACLRVRNRVLGSVVESILWLEGGRLMEHDGELVGRMLAETCFGPR